MATPAETRILLVEEAEKRANLRKLLVAAGAIVVGEAGFGTEAVTAAGDTRADVVLISVEEPLARPLRTIETLSLALPSVGVIAVSSLGDREYFRKAMLSGARDYLVRPVRPADLRRAIGDVHEAEQKRVAAQVGNADRLQRGDIITVFSPKGGIGKTTLAVNLAVAIAQATKQRVGFLDLDIRMGDAALLLDFVPDRTVIDAAEMAPQLEPESLHALLHADRTGVRVLAAPATVEDYVEFTGEQATKVLDVMAKTFDYVVVDTAPSMSDVEMAALDLSTLILLVTSPDLPSLKRSKIALGVMLKGWRYPEERVKLVINHPYAGNGVATKEVEATLDYPIFWKVPTDPTATVCANLGRPFVEAKPGSKIARNVVDLARSVCGLNRHGRGVAGLLLGR